VLGIISEWPLVTWLQRDDRLQHPDRSRIQRRFDPAQFTNHHFDLGNLRELNVLFLHDLQGGVE